MNPPAGTINDATIRAREPQASDVNEAAFGSDWSIIGRTEGKNWEEHQASAGAVLVQAAFGVPVDELANHYGFPPLWAVERLGRRDQRGQVREGVRQVGVHLAVQVGVARQHAPERVDVGPAEAPAPAAVQDVYPPRMLAGEGVGHLAEPRRTGAGSMV